MCIFIIIFRHFFVLTTNLYFICTKNGQNSHSLFSNDSYNSKCVAVKRDQFAKNEILAQNNSNIKTEKKNC